MSRTYIDLGVHTWDKFTATVRTRLRGPAPGGGDAGTNDSSSRRTWTGTAGLPQALDMAEKGWPDGAEQIARTLDSLPPSDAITTDWALAMSGQRPCVEAYLAGDPECMWSYDAGERQRPTMTLCVSANYSANQDPEHIRKYAAAVAAVARMLDASGVDSAIWNVRQNGTMHDSDRINLYAVMVRELGEPMDLAKIAFAFHPSMLRRMHFSYSEVQPEHIRLGIGSGSYGCHPYTVEESTVRSLWGANLGSGTVVCLPEPQELHHCQTVEAMCEAFAKLIEKKLAAA